MRVYLDELWLINGFVDYLLLKVTGNFTGAPIMHRRILLAAAVGGIYGVLCATPAFACLNGYIFRGMVSLFLCGISFGIRRCLIRQIAVLWGFTAAFGGVVLILTEMLSTPPSFIGGSVYYPTSFPLLVLTAGVSYGVISWVLGKLGHYGGDIVPVEVTANGRNVKLNAFRDTGNTLKDPISGTPVLVADMAVMRRLVPGCITEQTEPEHVVEQLYLLVPELKPRLIPYKTVGVAHGMLPALRPDEVKISGMKENCLIAFSSVSVSDGGGFEALLGGKQL